MILDIFIAAIIGLLAGGLVNLLADDLPFRRQPSLPTYPDGTPRPVTAWLGTSAFLLGQREPAIPKPDESRARPYYNEEGKILHTPTKLSWRYPLTELLTIGLMILTAAANIPEMTLVQLALYFVFMTFFALITVIDMEHRLILFVVIIPAIVLAIVDALVLSDVGPNFKEALSGAGLGFGVFFAMYLGGLAFNYVMAKIQNRELPTAFGYGDVMLITFSGALLGLTNVLVALFITIFLGAIGAILYLIGKRLFSRGGYSAFSAIPYGPYIVVATIIMLLYSDALVCRIWTWMPVCN
ncbi:MAG: A24 family peptidase [Anaerolineae bacterium]|nr:A24 family peptidase [Anaerolineae bacterium]